ncbi:hypothetical protein CEXT_417111 [Caerostris extrusa]|uniref:Uncharacterized protein n=1 Tax=Caerostris extrusa TaxID=172846 RepID=A0AAV4U3I6_CAEEX|nr:hypothetical protein CEXT_417111 [Caerostris extrusa]
MARKPHIICFDVSSDTEEKTLLDSLQEQFSEGTECMNDFAIKHHYKSRRGVNWIIEVDPKIWSKVTASRKLNLEVLDEISNSDHCLWDTEEPKQQHQNRMSINQRNWLTSKKIISSIVRANSLLDTDNLNNSIGNIQSEIKKKLSRTITSSNYSSPKKTQSGGQ